MVLAPFPMEERYVNHNIEDTSENDVGKLLPVPNTTYEGDVQKKIKERSSQPLDDGGPTDWTLVTKRRRTKR